MDSSAGASISIGNFKGVMLCNRPFAGISAAAKATKQASSTAPPPFRPACGSTEKLGLNPIRNPPNCVIDRRKKGCVLAKHKQWLAQLNSQKKKMEAELLEQQMLREEKRSKFREAQRKRRLKVVKERHHDERGMSEERVESKEEEGEVERERIVEEKEEEEEKRMDQGGREVKDRPMWALTEKSAEEVEEKEADSLVEFAKSLDFDQYMDDLEVRAALESMQNRVNKLKMRQSSASVAVPETKKLDEEVMGSDLEKAMLRRYYRKVGEGEEKEKDLEEMEEDVRSIASAKSFLSNTSVAR